MRFNYKKLGDYIRKVNTRNVDLKATNLLGINIDKFFMPSVANVVGTDMSKYKIVKKRQFSCNRMHVGRDYRLPISLSTSDEDFLVSPAYDVFEVKNEEELLPEYLMMWFLRKEFDRNSWFYTDADVRGGLHWDAFCDIELPIPSIEKQREIVKEYTVVKDRIELNNKLIQKLEETAQMIYKQWFVDFEFPDKNGKPYKSNDGEMVWCEGLEKEVPKGWEVKKLADFCEIKGGKRLPKGQQLNDNKTGNPYIKVANMGNSKFIVLNEQFQFVDEETQKSILSYIVTKGDVIISIVGTIGLINVIDESLINANLTENCAKIANLKKINSDFIYHYLSSSAGQRIIETKTVGGVQGKLPLYNIQTIPIILPSQKLLEDFEQIIMKINASLKCYMLQNSNFIELKDSLLSKLATIY